MGKQEQTGRLLHAFFLLTSFVFEMFFDLKKNFIDFMNNNQDVVHFCVRVRLLLICLSVSICFLFVYAYDLVYLLDLTLSTSPSVFPMPVRQVFSLHFCVPPTPSARFITRHHIIEALSQRRAEIERRIGLINGYHWILW
jgi:hypothetical protein